MWTAKNRRRYDRSALRYPSDPTDDEWAHVESLIPPASPDISHYVGTTARLSRHFSRGSTDVRCRGAEKRERELGI